MKDVLSKIEEIFGLPKSASQEPQNESHLLGNNANEKTERLKVQHLPDGSIVLTTSKLYIRVHRRQ